MTLPAEFGPQVAMDALRVTPEGASVIRDAVATEIPLTIVANEIELATLLASPSQLKELTYGYLFTSGFIQSIDDIKEYRCDQTRWTATVELSRTPDPAIIRKRLYTSGCGKCAMYTSINEVMMRRKLESSVVITRQQVFQLAQKLHEGSPLFKETGSVHSAFLIDPDSGREIAMDDVARHNAVDKVIGSGLMEGIEFPKCVLVRTGRTSSEIVYKVRKCEIPIIIARGAPTHQAVHLAQEMGITVIGFARSESFNIYTCKERVGL